MKNLVRSIPVQFKEILFEWNFLSFDQLLYFSFTDAKYMNKCEDKIVVGKLFNFKFCIDSGLKSESSKLFILISKPKITPVDLKTQYMWHMFVLIE